MMQLLYHCYITSHGLDFNPSKSICVVFGKSKLSCLQWYLKGMTLQICDSMKYLGVVLSNRTDSHSSQRLKAARGAFYTLQGAGLCVDGVQSEAMTRIYKQAVQPVLLYGMNCVFQNKKSIQSLDTAQGNFLKAAIGISKSCRTTPLLDGLEIHKIHKDIRIQELGLLKSAIRSTPRTRSFDCLLATVAKAKHYCTVC